MQIETARLTPAHISFLTIPSLLKNKDNWKRVSINQDKNKGKTVIATSDLKPSTNILQETPFIQQLNNQHRHTHCATCFKELEMEKKYTSCRNRCQWRLRYCSATCESEGWISSHKWLCSFPELETQLDLNSRLAFQGFIKSRSLKHNELPGLISNLDKHKTEDLQEYKKKAELLANLFYLSKKDIHTLITIQAQIKCNSFAIKNTQSNHVDGYDFVVSRDSIHLGQAVYLSASSLNHACSPSALVIFDREQPTLLKVLVTENVNNGKEVTISYGPLTSRQKKEERQSKLLNDYYFDCNCKDCTSDSVDKASCIYKCQICKKGRLYRNQETCKSCESKPYWNYYLKTEEEINSSRDLLKRLELQESILHSDTLAIGETVDQLAQKYCTSGQMKIAAKYCQRSLVITRLNYGTHSPETAEEMMKLSSILFNAQMKKEAINQINATLKLYAELGLNDPDDIDELETMKMQCLFMMG